MQRTASSQDPTRAKRVRMPWSPVRFDPPCGPPAGQSHTFHTAMASPARKTVRSKECPRLPLSLPRPWSPTCYARVVRSCAPFALQCTWCARCAPIVRATHPCASGMHAVRAVHAARCTAAGSAVHAVCTLRTRCGIGLLRLPETKFPEALDFPLLQATREKNRLCVMALGTATSSS